MKALFLSMFLLLVLCNGCGLREREKELEAKTEEINQREQKLLLFEKQLELKAEELARREVLIDSTMKSSGGDTTLIYNPALVGTWSVRMQCTETTCEGSAVGDVKNEQWTFSYEGRTVIARAFTNNQLSRIYSGSYTQTGISLNAQMDTSNTSAISVSLQIKNTNELEGQREIIRPNNCRILYAMKMSRN